MRDVDEFLADCDDVIDDWDGSADSASWAADGSHENYEPLELFDSHYVPALGRRIIDGVRDGAFPRVFWLDQATELPRQEDLHSPNAGSIGIELPVPPVRVDPVPPIRVDPAPQVQVDVSTERFQAALRRLTPLFRGITRVLGPAIRRATLRVGYLMALDRAAVTGAPRPVPPRPISRMTARQYRAARRRYGREVHAAKMARKRS